MSPTSAEQKPRPRLGLHEYRIGWICALPVEYAAAIILLDEEHEPPPYRENDSNVYTLGRMGKHNVVIACLPAGRQGGISAAVVAQSVVDRFPSVRIGLMVGVGGGIPVSHIDLRLGDVVVSKPGDDNGGVLQYDFEMAKGVGTCKRTGHLNMPPKLLLNVLTSMEANHFLGKHVSEKYLQQLEQQPTFSRAAAGPDRLYQSTYEHSASFTCDQCDPNQQVKRDDRLANEPIHIHYGTIASANKIIQDAITRDQIYRDLTSNILCFDREAAGLMNDFPCLVIRGVCDYSDSHRNSKWKPYAASTAAAVAKEIVSLIPEVEVAKLAPIASIPGGVGNGRPSADKFEDAALWMMPFVRNTKFTGRENILQTLHGWFKDTRLHHYAAIHGLGGSGKSAVAIEFAHQVREQHCSVFWISAIDQDRFERSYRDLAKLLRIPGADDLKNDNLALIQQKLDEPGMGKWLMVIDNLDEKDILFHNDPNQSGRRPWDTLPRNENGMILFTTRSRKIAVDTKSDFVAISQMDEREAQELLLKSLHDNQQPTTDTVAQLLETLTYLPLAIVQAAAFMNANDRSLREYLELIRETDQSIIDYLSQDFEDAFRDNRSKNAVLATWLISFGQIQKDDPLAADYLSFLACIAPQSIPETIFPPAEPTVRQIKAIGTLTAYQFLTQRRHIKNNDEKHIRQYDMHALIHRVSQNQLKIDHKWNQQLEKTMKRLKTVIPCGGHSKWREYQHYLPHGIYLADFYKTTDTKTSADLLFNIALCQASVGAYIGAQHNHKRVLQWRKQGLGPEHVDTLRSMHEVAFVLDNQGKYVEAEQLHRDTLALTEKVLGREHPSTLVSMNNLAQAMKSQGKYVEAEQLHRDTLALKEKVLGREHPSTLVSMGSLADVITSQGKYVKAEQLHRDTLALEEKVLGREHPSTLVSMNNLAQAMKSQGKYVEAEQLHRDTLALTEKVLGREHPSTLASMGSLAQVMDSQGKYVEAEQLHRDTLALEEKVLGREHPSTLVSMSSLAQVMDSQGKYVEAEQLHRDTLALEEKVLGREHPGTLASMSNLAKVLSSQGEYVEAEQLHRDTLALKEKVLGREHPSTLVSMNEVGVALHNQDMYIEAEKWFRQTLALLEKVMGQEHPEILNTMQNLAGVMSQQRKHTDAEALCQQALEGRIKKLGHQHPHTQWSIKQLKGIQHRRRLAEAASLPVQNLSPMEQEEDDDGTEEVALSTLDISSAPNQLPNDEKKLIPPSKYPNRTVPMSDQLLEEFQTQGTDPDTQPNSKQPATMLVEMAEHNLAPDTGVRRQNTRRRLADNTAANQSRRKRQRR